MNSVYEKSGVNVSLGDMFSAFAATVCRRTWKNTPHVAMYDYAEGHFRGPRAYEFVGLPEGCRMDAGMDGVGTKTGLIAAALSPRTAGYDLIAMTAMDRSRWGNLPLYLDNVLDVASLGATQKDTTYRFFCELMLGLEKAANELGIVLGYGGELAELGAFVGSENPDAKVKFNWAGHMHGVMHPDKIIRGNTIAVGDVVVAFPERGPRSNGISAIRRALRVRFGKEWWANQDAYSAILAASEPSVLYDRFFARLNGWYASDYEVVLPLKCIVHVTGGGIPGKFGHDVLFRLGLSADLEDLPNPPFILLECLNWLRQSGEDVSDADCYTMWHGGPGALAVVAPEYEGDLHRHAKKMGILARSCGRIVKLGKPQIRVRSKFGSDEVLVFS